MLVGLVVVPLAAQTAYLTGGSLITLGSGFRYPGGVAVDKDGNVFVADTGNYAVKEILAAGGYTTVNTLGGGGFFSSPQSLALDTYGNIFVADTGNLVVKVIPAVGGYYLVSPVTPANFWGMCVPTGVALDKNGNIFVASPLSGGATVGVFEFQALPGSVYPGTFVSGWSSGGSNPLPGAAVDGSGNFFIATGVGVMEVPSPNYDSAFPIGGWGTFNNPSGLAVDKYGNIYVADTGNNEVKVILAAGGYTTVNTLGGGFYQPQGVAVDGSGNVFVADTGNNAVKEILAGSAGRNFGTVSVGTGTPPTFTYEFMFTSGGTIGAPAVLTQGAAGEDFTDAGTGTCTTNGTSHIYVTDETCTVDVTFKPKYPGTRYGAIQLLNSSGAAIVTALLYGTGSGPQIAFAPGTQSMVGSGFRVPQGVAVDGAGNVFVADTFNSAVKVILAASGYATVRTLGSGFADPEGVAVDGAGNVFVADTFNNAVKEIVAANGVIPASPTIKILGNGFIMPTGVAVDQNGNVIVKDAITGNGVVKEILAASGYTTVNTLSGSLPYPVHQATDASGNVFTADANNDRVLRTDQAHPPQLIFAPTLVGSTSVDSPQTVTVSNIGNAALTFPIPSVGTNAGIWGSGFTLGNSGTCPELNSSSFSAGTVAAGTSCTYLVSFSPHGAGPAFASLVLTDNNLNASLTQTLALYGTTQNSQSISFSPPSSVTYGVTPITLSATGGASNNPVTFSIVSGPGALSGPNDSILTVTGAGTIVVSALQAGNANYAPAQTTADIVVSMATPSLTWSNPAAIVYGTSLSATQLNATASVPGTFVYTPTASTVLSAGTGQTLSVTFTPTDTTDYTTVSKTATINVLQADPTISWPTPAAITYGTALSATQLNATASVPGTFVYTPTASTVLSAGTGQTLSVSFTPTDTTDYTTVSNTVTINVLQANPTISWPTPAAITYGTALSATQLNATALIPGTFVYTPTVSTVLSAGTGQTLSVSFTPTDTTDYTTVSKTATINVLQANPTISWPTPAAITYGTALSATQLNATASVPGTFVYTPTVSTVLSAGTGQTLSVSFTPTDTTDYTTVSNTVTINVLQANPTISWPTPAAITYGTALSATQLNATALIPGTFVYTPTVSTVLSAGTGQTLSVSFTPTDTTDYTTVSKTATINVLQANPTISWPTPAAITYGTALSATQLNATASVPGTFVYTPAAGTVLPAGTQTLSVSFTPTDTANYNQATQTVSINDTEIMVTALSGSTPTSLTLAAGTQGSMQFTLGAMGTLSSTITFACSGLPVGAQCVFSPTSVNPADLPATVTVTITTTGPTILGRNRQSGWPWMLALFVPGLLLLPINGSEHRRRKLWVVIVIVLLLMIAFAGCGGSPAGSNTQLRTPAGTYPVTLTVSSAGATQSTANFNLIVTR